MKIIERMPAAEYHAHPAVSKSVLDKIARSPLHCRAYLDGARDEQTAAMAFGSAFHCSVLEPDLFSKTYAPFSGDRRTKAGKEAYENLLAQGVTILDVKDWDLITAMTDIIREHETAGDLLSGPGKAEASVFWTDANTGLECKCRPDWWREDGVVVDLKTCEDASPTGFARNVATYRYQVQAAHYLAGTQARKFVFVAIEKKPPYAVAVYELDEEALLQGDRLRWRDLEMYASCCEFGAWPGYPVGIQSLSLPTWAANQGE